jgi:MFS superfamily sulfate permease-like transporter
LAAVLLYVGYQLSPVRLYRHMLRRPLELALPFAVTIIGVILTDLLKGVGIGLAIAVLFVLVRNTRSALVVTRREEGERERITIRLAEHVSFFDKASVRRALDELPAGCSVEIDGSASRHVHPDVLELVHDLASSGPSRDIEVVLVDIPHRASEVPSH